MLREILVAILAAGLDHLAIAIFPAARKSVLKRCEEAGLTARASLRQSTAETFDRRAQVARRRHLPELEDRGQHISLLRPGAQMGRGVGCAAVARRRGWRSIASADAASGDLVLVDFVPGFAELLRVALDEVSALVASRRSRGRLLCEKVSS